MVMDALKVDSLAHAFINYASCSNEDKARYEDERFEIDDLCGDFPEDMWTVILRIHILSDNPKVLSVLSAGLLENLLSTHPDQSISWVENEAAQNSDFKNLLRGVWQNLMPDEIWERVCESSLKCDGLR